MGTHKINHIEGRVHTQLMSTVDTVHYVVSGVHWNTNNADTCLILTLKFATTNYEVLKFRYMNEKILQAGLSFSTVRTIRHVHQFRSARELPCRSCITTWETVVLIKAAWHCRRILESSDRSLPCKSPWQSEVSTFIVQCVILLIGVSWIHVTELIFFLQVYTKFIHLHTDVEDFKSWSWWIPKGLIFLVDQSKYSKGIRYRCGPHTL